MDHFLQINSAIERSKDLFGRHVKAFVRVAGRLQQGGGGQSRRLLHLYPHDRRGLRRHPRARHPHRALLLSSTGRGSNPRPADRTKLVPSDQKKFSEHRSETYRVKS